MRVCGPWSVWLMKAWRWWTWRPTGRGTTATTSSHGTAAPTHNQQKPYTPRLGHLILASCSWWCCSLDSPSSCLPSAGPYRGRTLLLGSYHVVGRPTTDEQVECGATTASRSCCGWWVRVNDEVPSWWARVEGVPGSRAVPRVLPRGGRRRRQGASCCCGAGAGAGTSAAFLYHRVRPTPTSSPSLLRPVSDCPSLRWC